MSNTEFPAFHETYPAGDTRAAFDDARPGAFAAKVPAEIANEWRTFCDGDEDHDHRRPRCAGGDRGLYFDRL